MSGPVRGDEERSCPMEEQAVGWALQALEPDEELAMRYHLADCRSCRDTVRETESVMGALAGAVEQIEPPPQLGDGILAGAVDTPQVRPDASPGTTPGARAVSTGSGSGRTPRSRANGEAGLGPPTRAGRPHRRWGLSRRQRLVTAVVSVAAVLGVGGLVGYTAQVQQQRDAQIAQSRSLAELLTELDRPGTTHATLRTAEGEAVAAVLTSPSDRVVVTAGLAPNDPRDTVYVVWGLGAGDPRPLGTFDVAGPGSGVQSIGPASADQSSFSGYAVSLEPGRTMPASPTTVVATGHVQA